MRSITRRQWITLFAAQAGYMLDAMDVLLFVLTINVLREAFHLSAAQAGLVSSFTLAFSAAGGIVFGILSDRIGRARSLILSILIFSAASAGTAASWNLASLLFCRAVIGVGLGAEWSTGAVLVAETWPPEHRAKAVSPCDALALVMRATVVGDRYLIHTHPVTTYLAGDLRLDAEAILGEVQAP